MTLMRSDLAKHDEASLRAYFATTAGRADLASAPRVFSADGDGRPMSVDEAVAALLSEVPDVKKHAAAERGERNP